MTTNNAISANDTGIPRANVGAFMMRVQDEATVLAGILEGIDILTEVDRGRNAITALIPIALAQIQKIGSDCDFVNWPKAMETHGAGNGI